MNVKSDFRSFDNTLVTGSSFFLDQGLTGCMSIYLCAKSLIRSHVGLDTITSF